jgi:uncharacterized protein (DUF1330 family)
MIVTNALIPTGEQLSALAADDRDEPIVMLNLLKFRATAAYDDGRDADLSGRDAYQRYADQMVPYVESRGGRVLFMGDVRALVVGAVADNWDTAALVQYPSPREFVQIAMSPEVHAFAFHREAGLEGQLLLMITQR